MRKTAEVLACLLGSGNHNLLLELSIYTIQVVFLGVQVVAFFFSILRLQSDHFVDLVVKAGELNFFLCHFSRDSQLAIFV